MKQGATNTRLTEALRQEICHTLKSLKEWMRPQRRPTPFLLWPSRSSVMPCPLGVEPLRRKLAAAIARS